MSDKSELQKAVKTFTEAEQEAEDAVNKAIEHHRQNHKAQEETPSRPY